MAPVLSSMALSFCRVQSNRKPPHTTRPVLLPQPPSCLTPSSPPTPPQGLEKQKASPCPSSLPNNLHAPLPSTPTAHTPALPQGCHPTGQCFMNSQALLNECQSGLNAFLAEGEAPSGGFSQVQGFTSPLANVTCETFCLGVHLSNGYKLMVFKLFT